MFTTEMTLTIATEEWTQQAKSSDLDMEGSERVRNDTVANEDWTQ